MTWNPNKQNSCDIQHAAAFGTMRHLNAWSRIHEKQPWNAAAQ